MNSLSPLLQDWIGVIVRGVMLIAASMGHTLSTSDVTRYATDAVMVAVFLWSMYQKHAQQQKTVVALAAARLPLTAVEDKIANASTIDPIPSPFTPADKVPIAVP